MIQSPCINVCRMDENKRLCLGCFRTLEEIAGWSRADDGARADILAAVARRRLVATNGTNALPVTGEHHG